MIRPLFLVIPTTSHAVIHLVFFSKLFVMSVSEEDLKLLEVFHNLKVKPKIESPEDLESFVKHFAKELEHETSDSAGAGATSKVHVHPPTAGGRNYPRISTFYGEENKGEVSWPTFSLK